MGLEVLADQCRRRNQPSTGASSSHESGRKGDGLIDFFGVVSTCVELRGVATFDRRRRRNMSVTDYSCVIYPCFYQKSKGKSYRQSARLSWLSPNTVLVVIDLVPFSPDRGKRVFADAAE